MLNQAASSSGAFVVGDQKVCILYIESSKALQQTFWNTNNGGKKELSMLNQTASSSGAFVVGGQKVCILYIESFKELQQTFWNTNNGGKKYKVHFKHIYSCKKKLFENGTSVFETKQTSVNFEPLPSKTFFKILKSFEMYLKWINAFRFKKQTRM